MSFNIIRKKVINYLLKEFNCNSENNLKENFSKDYLLDYDIFIKQIIFEIYYENYFDKMASQSIASLFEDNNGQLSDNSNYKKALRTHKKYRTYQDNLSLKYNDGKDVQFEKLKQGVQSFNGRNIYSYQINQLKNLDEKNYKIFNEIVKGTLGNSHNLSNNKLCEYLNDYKEIYVDISNAEKTSFNISLQLYQLEIGNRIETCYKVANKVSNLGISQKEQINILNGLKCLFVVGDLTRMYQNKFILGMDTYIDYHINSYINGMKNNNRVYKEIYILSEKKYVIRNSILQWIKENKISLDYDEYNPICKNFFGDMQHISKNKNWCKVIKTFRLIFK